MRRRQFLRSASALAGVTAVPLAQAAACLAPARFTLLRADDATPGSRFRPVAESPCPECANDTLQVSIGPLQAATGRAVVDELALHAMFDLPGGQGVPFVAWRYAAGPVPSQTDRARFTAGRATMRRLEIEYRLSGDASCRREHCAFTTLSLPRLSPGHYVLLGPNADGSPAHARGLRHGGDVLAPLAGLASRDFDYLAIQVEAPA